MTKSQQNAQTFAWMPLIGFDKDLPDKGLDLVRQKMKFHLDGVCLMLGHPDIVHHHNGLDDVKVLPPDMCSYYANPYNEERCRQDWTNHDLRDLVSQLNANDTEVFLSIFGFTLGNFFHEEWAYDHPEILRSGRENVAHIFVLKRFKDGTYYEDFFIDKLCQVMLDYGFDGIHVADLFCPPIGMAKDGDFSIDTMKQFSEQTGFEFPASLMEDTAETIENAARRGDWIWANCREQWLNFLCVRWEQFFKKLCDRMHAIGKKVFVLAMYCTDPFDTIYCKGIDIKRLADAGVDYFMPNMAANSVSSTRNRHWQYHEWSNMIPLTDLCVPNAKKFNMLAVKDVSEEWDMITHRPTLLDRDIGYLPSFVRYQGDGTLKRCLDGFNVCLADGVRTEDWQWLRERFDIAFDKMPQKPLAPTFVWSDTVHANMLSEYIKTRRWTPHKTVSELNRAGAFMGASVRVEDIGKECGNLFVPNFDMLSEDEKKSLASYKWGAVICTARGDFDPADYGIEPDISFTDTQSPFETKAFAFGLDVSDKEEILALAAQKDDSPCIEDPFNARESTCTLADVMPYQKVSRGFVDALALVVKSTYSQLFTSTLPVIPYKMDDGAIRLYVINDDRDHYGDAVITVFQGIERVDNVSKFPLLPVKFSKDGTFNFMTGHEPGDLRCFRVRVPHGGLAIVDVYFKNR